MNNDPQPHPTLNPYQPPAPLAETAELNSLRDRIALHGQVTIDDVASLMDMPWLFRIFQVVCVVSVALFSLIPLVAVFLRPSEWEVIMSMIGMIAVLAAVLFVCNWFLGRRWRAKRLIKRIPGILGPIEAWIDDFGLTYQSDSSGQSYQISWATFSDVAIYKEGLRLGWTKGVPHTIAVPSRCIDGYSITELKKHVKEFRDRATEPAICQTPPQWDQTPEGAFPFTCLFPLKPPLTLLELRRIKIFNAMQYAGFAIGLPVFFMAGLHWAMLTVGIAPGLVMLVGGQDYRRAAPDAYANRMWGWITRDGACGHLPGFRWEVCWSNASKWEVNEQYFLAEFADGSGLHLTPDDVSGDWTSMLQALPGKGELANSQRFL